jgi:hypothetical protein
VNDEPDSKSFDCREYFYVSETCTETFYPPSPLFRADRKPTQTKENAEHVEQVGCFVTDLAGLPGIQRRIVETSNKKRQRVEILEIEYELVFSFINTNIFWYARLPGTQAALQGTEGSQTIASAFEHGAW